MGHTQCVGNLLCVLNIDKGAAGSFIAEVNIVIVK